MLILEQFNKIIVLEIQIKQETRIFFILEEAKETVLDFSQGIVKVL